MCASFALAVCSVFFPFYSQWILHSRSTCAHAHNVWEPSTVCPRYPPGCNKQCMAKCKCCLCTKNTVAERIAVRKWRMTFSERGFLSSCDWGAANRSKNCQSASKYTCTSLLVPTKNLENIITITSLIFFFKLLLHFTTLQMRSC